MFHQMHTPLAHPFSTSSSAIAMFASFSLYCVGEPVDCGVGSVEVLTLLEGLLEPRIERQARLVVRKECEIG